MTTGRTLTRRQVLGGFGVLGTTGAAFGASGIVRAFTDDPDTVARSLDRRAPGFDAWLWHDPRSWDDGRVPGPGDVAVVTRPVLVEGHVSVAGIVIQNHAALVLSPDTSTLVESSGNVVVRGRLVMQPSSAAVKHTLRFVNVDEQAFVGGHTMEPQATDVGLWVDHRGQLVAEGTPKRGWGHGWDPSWQLGDEVRRTPTALGDFATFAAHGPGDAVPAAYGYKAEVFNLTRNVVIEGTPGGRAHIMFNHAHRPQVLRYVEIRHMGPRKPITGGSEKVLGRYGLHFHMCGDATRGTVVEGVSIHRSGNHSFVAHSSHGITFRDCVAYDVLETAYWWDPPDDTSDHHTHDTLYERCLAAKINGDPNRTARSLAGFAMHTGLRNKAIGCVTVGVQGNTNASGYDWPSKANHNQNVWIFEDCVAHNNRYNGIFIWQNDANPHVIDRFTAYHNGKTGIETGAYGNPYRFRDVVLIANGGWEGSHQTAAQAIQLANSRWNSVTKTGAGYERARLDAAGQSRATVVSHHHKLEGDHPIEWIDSVFTGAPYVLEIDEKSGGKPASLDFVRARVGPEGRDMKPSDVLITLNETGSIVRIQSQDGKTAWQIAPDGKVTSIAPFHS
jgi:hypothetical protein